MIIILFLKVQLEWSRSTDWIISPHLSISWKNCDHISIFEVPWHSQNKKFLRNFKSTYEYCTFANETSKLQRPHKRNHIHGRHYWQRNKIHYSEFNAWVDTDVIKMVIEHKDFQSNWMVLWELTKLYLIYTIRYSASG